MNDFIHLRQNTEYSLSKGIIKIKDSVNKAVEDNMGALAVTDLNNMFGAIQFYEAAQKKGIKPIIGVDLTVSEDVEVIVEKDGVPTPVMERQRFQMIFLAKDQAGYKNLMRLVTKAYEENRDKVGVSIKKEWLLDEDFRKGLILLSGAKEGDIGGSILNDDLVDAENRALFWRELFKDDFFIELQRDASHTETVYMDGAMHIAQKFNIPVVATHPTLFLEKEDFLPHEAKVCINAGDILQDKKREILYNKEQYFKTKEEMQELFSDIPQALANTAAIAKKCNITLDLGRPQLPNFPTPNNETPEEFFEKAAWTGFEQRMVEEYGADYKQKLGKDELNKYKERLETEIGVIKQMGFASYFLIVSDFITWAKEHDIPVGPGRGSGAGSLVAYSLQITELDPLKYDLLFERFLNPERVSMPDFDIDFCQERRTEVIQYVTEKYGKDAVSQIGTFSTLGGKGVVRDIGRVLGMQYNFVDGLAKMINISPAHPQTLMEYIEEDDKLKERMENEPDVKKLIDIAVKLEGLTRQVGKHAAGVLIANGKLTDYTPIYDSGDGNGAASQFDKDDVEKAGLVKFDFLGLRNLTIVHDAVKLINKRPEFNGEKEFNIKKIPLDDPNVFKVFTDGNTTAVFQSEAKGAKQLEMDLKPDNFEDIIALMALNRPGPLGSGMVDTYVARKHGNQEIDYLHPSLEEILKPTYGVIVYQEQVMKVAQKLSGFTLGSADILRKAMGKKKPEEMAKLKGAFVEGAFKNNVPREKSTEIFELIEKFAEYGFNKSHSAAYALIAYQTAYLKNYYPTEFMTATLNSEIDNTDKLAVFINDCKNNNIKILPPDINQSDVLFTVNEDKTIRYGFAAIKSVGVSAAQAILNARSKPNDAGFTEDFLDVYDFLERIGKGPVNKRTVEGLTKAGAFDLLEPNRAALFASLEQNMEYLDKFSKRQLQNDSPLEELFGKKKSKKQLEPLVRPTLKDVEPWSELEKLDFEKTSLGYYLTGNPFLEYTKKLDGLKSVTALSDLEELYLNKVQQAHIAGTVEDIVLFKSKKGAFVKISDGVSENDIKVFAEDLENNKTWLKKGAFVSFVAKIEDDYRGEGFSLSAERVMNFNQTEVAIIDKMFVGASDNKEDFDKFMEICNRHQGPKEIILCVDNPDTGRKNKKVASIKVEPSEALLEELRNGFSDKFVKYKGVDTLDFFKYGKKKRYNKKNSY